MDEEGKKHYFGDSFGTSVIDETTNHVSEAMESMRVLKFTREGAKDAASEAHKVICLPQCEEFFSAIPLATVLQLLAYHVALLRGCDIDKPRNLAKSVTVE